MCRWYGPYRVIEQIGELNYTIELVSPRFRGAAPKRDLVHIVRMKRYFSRSSKDYEPDNYVSGSDSDDGACHIDDPTVDQADSSPPDPPSVAATSSPLPPEPDAEPPGPSTADDVKTSRPQRKRAPPSRFRDFDMDSDD